MLLHINALTLFYYKIVLAVVPYKLEFSPYFFSFIFITIIGENNADNTTNNHRFPVKILYDCNKPANPSPALMYDDKSNKFVSINHIMPNII